MSRQLSFAQAGASVPASGASPLSSEPGSPLAHASASHDEELFANLVMQLEMAGAEAQLASMCLQQGSRRSSLGSASTCSSSGGGSQMSNEEFEGFLFAALQEELAAHATGQH